MFFPENCGEIIEPNICLGRRIISMFAIFCNLLYNTCVINNDRFAYGNPT